jgi:NAD(P)-dependent dehydrogenase (short-subunit alcohol dehydrogenase family)
VRLIKRDLNPTPSMELGKLNVTSLRGKVAIVTGAGRGIGKSIAIELASKGAQVCVVSRTQKEIQDTATQVRALKGRVYAKNMDVADRGAVENFVSELISKFGRIDILVNNAGILGPIGPIETNDAKSWGETMRINVEGVFLFCKFAIPIMKERRRGKIINLSGSGAPNPYPMFTAYSASKNAVLGFTQTLAAELRRFNIQVNAVAPGPISTRMQDEILSASQAGESTRAMARSIKRGRGASVQAVAELVSFLSSDKSEGLTGKLLSSRWDDWRSFSTANKLRSLNLSDLYTVRRIDNVFYSRVGGMSSS